MLGIKNADVLILYKLRLSLCRNIFSHDAKAKKNTRLTT